MKVLLSVVLLTSVALAQTDSATSTVTSTSSVKTASKAKTKKVAKNKAKKAINGATVAPSVEMNTTVNPPAGASTPESTGVAGGVTVVDKATSASATAGTAGQSITTIAETKKETPLYSGLFNITSEVIVSDLKDSNKNAPIDNVGTLQVFRKITEKQKVGLGYNFQAKIVSDSSQLNDFNGDNGTAYKTLDPAIHHSYKLDSQLWGAPVTIASRYILPLSETTKATKALGTFRTQTYITWVMNPKFDVSALGQMRLTLNTQDNSNQKVGADSVLRLIAGPNFGYNYNDNFSAYYTPYVDLKSTGYQRSNFSADTANNLSHEVGLWITTFKGKFIINPLWSTTGDQLGKTSYEGLGADANSVYDLNLIAYF